MKKIVLPVLMLGIILLSAGCAKKSQFTLYTWDGMFPQDILSGFEKDTGIKINYVNFDTDETMLMKLQAAKGGSYDLVIADDYIVQKSIGLGLAQKLDKPKLVNYKNINPVYQKQFFDPTDEYTIPYGAGIQTIVYNPKTVKINIRRYSDLWNQSLANSIGLIGNPRVINGMALKVLGCSYNTNNLGEIQKAGDLMKIMAPNVHLIRDDNLQDELISGEISVAVMYTSQATNTMVQAPDMKMVFPEEGIGFGIMASFIPSRAPNAEAAYKFLDYILDAERGARCFESLGYYCTWLASEPYIKPEMKNLLTLPQGLNAGNMEMIQNISPEAEELHNKIWTEFKTACGQ
ncbi:MAG: spermidine/putrescine ABC transporter substrate-binding protein [Treponema sp.]|nr:spermidine/putrescine ABC transporter substrate-binding protein [Treponema sp.]